MCIRDSPGRVHAILLGLVFEKIVENQLFFYKEALVEIRKGILEERITKQHFIAIRVS